ncbi:MAG: bifunctional pyr operon transcriptional regulator/uracil phosphoribosyltransferase [Candidatus Omnitrophica bacterium CG11_big_fil_rev_8_21_14_0_20_64_10]|nr:MAG: bifunctional pyr operon transcriptional regulator/uracil phosphoribosyltransferase [Candidatus Omnitrophica bacterium CG11_big_fil_rev_8_21_14_0_20_64_10]
MGRLMDAAGIDRALTRIAHELLEQRGAGESVALVGIRSRGDLLAQRLARKIQELPEGAGRPILMGALDITLYRDDVGLAAPQPAAPVIHATEVPFDVTGRRVVIVDDVLFTGRTVRAAMDALTDLGRPQAIELAVLVDRGHRELPIKANHIGKNIPTARRDRVQVRLLETDGADEVMVEEGRDAVDA